MITYEDYLKENDIFSILEKKRQYARTLINQQIWDSITHQNLDAWLSNFKEPREKLLAALLLDNFLYRSAKQTKSLLKHAFDSVLPNIISNTPQNTLLEKDYLKHFSQPRKSNDMRIVPIIRDLDPPTKSGPSVARLYKRHLRFSDDNMIWPWLVESELKNGINTFIFIDDIVGTGHQFIESIEKYISKDIDAKLIYIPLLAHKKGINYIKSERPDILVSAVETVDDSFSFFNSTSAREFSNIKDLYIEVSRKILNKRFYKIMALGYEGLSLTFSYYHSTPNATLPLYWFESEDFHPLVTR